MPAQFGAAPRVQRADAHTPNAALNADAGAFAPALARVWPRPHRGYLDAEPARRHLARMAVTWTARIDLRELPEALAFWSVKRVLAAYLPDAPAGLAEALKKLEGESWSRTAYAVLLAALRENGEAAKALRHAARIDPVFIGVIEALPDALCRPRLLAHIEDPRIAALVARGAKRACPDGAPGDLARLAARLERARSTPNLFRMLIEEIGLEKLAPPPAPGAPWFVPLTSSGAICRAALRFENCLKGRIPLLLLGRAAYYEVVGEEPAVVEIVREKAGGWCVGEVRGHANASISDDLWHRIRAHLEAHGARTRWQHQPDALAIALAQAAGW